MDIHSLTSTHLKQAINLYAKKEALQEQLATVDEQISSLLGGTSLTQHKGARPNSKIAKAPKGRAAKSGRRGSLKESILAELRAAGAQGVSVKDLVESSRARAPICTPGFM